MQNREIFSALNAWQDMLKDVRIRRRGLAKVMGMWKNRIAGAAWQCFNGTAVPRVHRYYRELACGELAGDARRIAVLN